MSGPTSGGHYVALNGGSGGAKEKWSRNLGRIFFGDITPSIRKGSEPWNPESKANFLSRITFWWVGSLIGLGNRKPLTADDLWDINKGDSTDNIAPLIDQSWTQQLSKPKSSLAAALWAIFGLQFSLAGLIKICHDSLQFMSPVLLKQIMVYLQNPEAPLQQGVLIVLLLLFCNSVQSICLNNYFHQVYRISIRIRVALVSLIYDKSLKISASARQRTSAGQIVNLQSNDAEKIASLVIFLHIVWSGPFQILGALALLFSIIGVIPALCGFAVMVLSMPMNALLARWLTNIRKRLVQATDARVKMISEIINGIKAIKLYAWEQPFRERVDALRDAEMAEIKSTILLANTQRFVIGLNTLLVAVVSLSAYSFLGYPLVASVAFPALALFNQLQFPLTVLPRLINNIVQAGVSIDRLEKFLNLPETKPIDRSPAEEDKSLQIVEGSFTWADESEDGSREDTLRAINLRAKPGQLLIIIGEVGSGKSSLLAAFLGEIRKTSGSVFVNGSIAYTAQDPWIRNATLENNILMGRPMDRAKYERTVRVCALLEDLSTLPGGDQAEIGEKGINLSGGQKHRVALARAVYADADIYLLDDPLSAVDTHVGRHLFDECICGEIQKSTRVLVTHQLQYAESADAIAVVSNGQIQAYGTFQELKQQGIDFSHFQIVDQSSNTEDLIDVPSTDPTQTKQLTSQTIEVPAKGSGPPPKGQQEAAEVPAGNKGKASSSTLIQQEHRAIGRVKGSIYWAYFKAWGPRMIMPSLVLLVFIIAQLAKLGNDAWLAVWTQGVQAGSTSIMFYLGVYCLTALIAAAMNLFRSLLLAFSSLAAARNLHRQLLDQTLKLPMKFFDTQPAGRLVNRFTRDTEQVDLNLPDTLLSFVSFVFQTLFAIGLIIYVTPVFFFPLVPVVVLYQAIQDFYVSTSRELRRIDSISRSPIFAHFGESIQGLATIRAFSSQLAFTLENHARIDASTRANFSTVAANRWLGVRSDFLAALTVFCTALLCVLAHSGNPGFAGLAITNALTITSYMNWLVRSSAELETQMNSVERVMEYASLEAEAPAIIDSCRPARGWPEQGAIEAYNVTVRYRPELNPVLRDLSFSIEGGEKVGVCGRTGCGKTTLMMSIFRIMELEGGSIVIDGVDISRIGLFDLRRKLALVPQDPVVFSGSVRFNLDPFGEAKSDVELWEAIDRAGMTACIQNLPGQLDASVSEGGSNFSTGQRQLLCMARALLRGTQILILDEATSNVDSATDVVIQSTIRGSFKGCTVLTIAHRLHTIIDSDRIMLLEHGRLQEFDSPSNLLADEGSKFSGFVDQTLPREAAMLRNAASFRRSSSKPSFSLIDA